jgi:hypothetical protein
VFCSASPLQHDDASRDFILIQHNDASRDFILIQRNDASRDFILIQHNDASRDFMPDPAESGIESRSPFRYLPIMTCQIVFCQVKACRTAPASPSESRRPARSRASAWTNRLNQAP